jgi:hypothetical protein
MLGILLSLEVAQIFGPLFSTVKVMYSLGKVLGDFFRKLVLGQFLKGCLAETLSPGGGCA